MVRSTRADWSEVTWVLTEVGSATRLRAHFAAEIQDTAENVHSRDAFAAECNRKVGPRTRWGCTLHGQRNI